MLIQTRDEDQEIDEPLKVKLMMNALGYKHD